VFKRCGCRDEVGRQYGTKCPKLGAKGHGTWNFVVDFGQTPEGKRKQVSEGKFRTKTEAQERLQEVLDGRRKGHRLPTRTKVGEYLQQWLTDKTDPSGIGASGRQVAPGTAALYRQHIDLLTVHLGNLWLSDLHDDDIVKAYRQITADRGIGVATQRRIHGTLRAALNAATRKRLIPYNPALSVDLAPEQRAPVKPWQASELGTFLDAVSEHPFGPLFETIAYLGLRRGEALGLRWSDVDLVHGTLTVHQTWRGRTDSQARPLFDPPKTAGRKDQQLDLPAPVLNALNVQRLRQDLDRCEWRQGYEDHDLVFTRSDGHPLTPAHVTRTFGELASQAGLRHVRLHDLRHGAASLMLASGTSIEVASKILGHSSVGITSKTYSHLLADVQRQASERAAGLVPRTEIRQDVITS